MYMYRVVLVVVVILKSCAHIGFLQDCIVCAVFKISCMVAIKPWSNVMKLFMYSVFDRCSGVYDRPFPSRSDAEAIRSFTDIACDTDHPIGKHPGDFTMFRVGTWDDNTGNLDCNAPEKVINGLEAVASRENVAEFPSAGGTA